MPQHKSTYGIYCQDPSRPDHAPSSRLLTQQSNHLYRLSPVPMLPSCAFLPLVVRSLDHRSLQLGVHDSVLLQSTHRTQREYHQQCMPLKGSPIGLRRHPPTSRHTSGLFLPFACLLSCWTEETSSGTMDRFAWRVLRHAVQCFLRRRHRLQRVKDIRGIRLDSQRSCFCIGRKRVEVELEKDGGAISAAYAANYNVV